MLKCIFELIISHLLTLRLYLARLNFEFIVDYLKLISLTEMCNIFLPSYLDEHISVEQEED